MTLLGGARAAHAVDVPITGLKLIVVNNLAIAGKAKVVFVAKDGAVTKGTGTDPGQIAATLDVSYDAFRGTFDMPSGTRWLVNSASVAKYVDKTAPTSGAVKVSVVKPNSLLRVVGKSLGDTPLNIASAPSGAVYVADTIVNGGQTTRLCTQFVGCTHTLIAGGSGYKLVCKGNSSGDLGCTAAAPTTTTTSSTTSTTLICCDGFDTNCAWSPSAALCNSLGGIPRAPGTVCNSASGTGTCTAPPASPGPCCSYRSGLGTDCAAGLNAKGYCEQVLNQPAGPGICPADGGPCIQ